MYGKEALMIAGAAAAGAAQTVVLKKFVDGKFTLPLGPLGAPSTFLGVVGGAIALGLGFYTMQTGKLISDPRVQYMMMAYGGSAFVSGILATGFVPGFGTASASSATPPARRVVTSSVPSQPTPVQRAVVAPRMSRLIEENIL